MVDWSVDADEAQNGLYLDLGGHFGPEEAKKANEAAREAVQRLDPGFEVITDLSEFVPGDQDAVECIEEGKQAVREAGAFAAVRATGERSATGRMHFQRVGEDEEEYTVAVADTVEQAEKFLDKRTASQ
ncbi:hypothetical protein [Halorientalis regularis]|jgi:hypothetical protein|uniref:Uncharacterized protein n=1 Tax=Halorientalis regularis TaxID=660518 RepID=A0A1G7L433_9EURY|nr:hypothetical protein [Halorientalis regularis]SDF44223.1 hypothetical protein SAMN05216218_106153 [Halorientalis regularis]